MPQRFRFDVEGEPLPAVVYAASKPLGLTLLLGHGASGAQRDAFIVDHALGLADRGVLVVTYDFPYVAAGRSRPDRNEVLEASCRAAVLAARQCRPKNRLFIGGKSLGGRVACEVAASGVEEIHGVVLLGYPLHAVGQPYAPRWGRLRDLRVPALIVQGTRDVFGTPAQLGTVLAELPEGTRIHAVEGGDHSFALPPRRRGEQGQVHDSIMDEIAEWMSLVGTAPLAQPGTPRPRPIAPRIGDQLRSLRVSASS